MNTLLSILFVLISVTAVTGGIYTSLQFDQLYMRISGMITFVGCGMVLSGVAWMMWRGM